MPVVHIMENVEATMLYDIMKKTHINIGTGEDLTIKELAALVKETIGFNGELEWDSSKPDGTPEKQLDVSLLDELSWKYNISLQQGIGNVYSNYIG
jgi:GDP-L-fucose synthase